MLYVAAVEVVCMLCGVETIHWPTATNFHGMTCEECWDMVMYAAQCKKCLKPGHIGSKCLVPPMSKKCQKYYHTLLHKEAGMKPETLKASSS